MLEYDGPANNFVVSGLPLRYRRPKTDTTPVAKLDASKAKERAGIRLPNVVVDGLTLTANLRVEDDEYPDTSCYGDWRDSKRDADKIRKARREGYLVVKRCDAGRNEYDTWISSEKVVDDRVARRVSYCGSRTYLNRTEARGPHNEGLRRWQREMYEIRRDDEIGAVTVTIRLYLNGTQVARTCIGAELGSWKTEDDALADVASDLMHEARAEAAATIADLRAAICRVPVVA